MNIKTKKVKCSIKFTKEQAFNCIAFSDATKYYNEFMSDRALLRFDPCPRCGKTPRA